MPKIKIGYRRLFEAIECSITNKSVVNISKQLSNGLFVHLYFGPKPIFGRHKTWGGKYAILNPPSKTHFGPYEPLSNPPDGFYTEIVCCEEIEVTDEEYTNIKTRQGDTENQLIAHLRIDKYKHLNIVNWFAGAIGIKIHRQFVTEPVIEKSLICNSDWSSLSDAFLSPGWELMFNISIQEDEMPLLENVLNLYPTIPENVNKFGIAFEWLMRAWDQRDVKNRFIAFFIPLEIAVNFLNLEINTLNSELVDALNIACNNSVLIDAIKERIGKWRPSLRASFEFIAERYKLDGWERDIEAFRIFNRMRNNLLHGNSSDISETVKFSNPEEDRKLEDLVERYLCRIIFGNVDLYKSFIRAKKSANVATNPA